MLDPEHCVDCREVKRDLELAEQRVGRHEEFHRKSNLLEAKLTPHRFRFAGSHYGDMCSDCHLKEGAPIHGKGAEHEYFFPAFKAGNK